MSLHRDTESALDLPFRLGEWRIDPALNRISDGKVTHQVEPRVMDVLVCLASRPGEVFSRDDLLQAVWQDVVVGEEALTRAISELRRLLEDDHRSPRFVETIRKGGYRLVSPVETVAEPPARSRLGLWWTVGALLVVILLVAGLALLRGGGHRESRPLRMLAATPLTSYPGAEEFPAISPDGGFVAFAWGGDEEDNIDVYVKQIGSESPLRLTTHPGVDTYPRWSADGKTLTYLHIDETGQALYSIPLIGGQPRELLRASAWLAGHDLSPDGESLVFSEAAEPDGPAQLFVLDLDSLERRPLVSTVEGLDVGPVFSPDGKTIAFLRMDGAGLQDIYLVPAKGGKPRRVTQGLLQVRGMDWTRDGRSLICAAVSSAYYGLWLVDLKDGDLTRVPTRAEWIHFPTIARHADRLVYQEISFEKNIWRVRRDEDPELGLATEALITSTRWDCEACYSPDGKRVAFTSARSGSLEIWAADADGERPLQLTRFEGLNVGNPRWSPDGTRVAFHAGTQGLPELFVVGADGAPAEQLTHDGSNHLLSSWSRDGEWLYFGSDRGGSWELWKLRVADPDDSLIQVTHEGGISGFESADGRSLYFAYPDRAGLARMPIRESGSVGDPEWILQDYPRQGDWGNWWLSDRGIALSGGDNEGP
ncbi:hypothetical protein DRQ32_10580, partial [bacterium]